MLEWKVTELNVWCSARVWSNDCWVDRIARLL